MKLTKATEYAMLAMVHLAKQPGISDTARIAEAEGIPPAFLVKVIPQLVRAGLVRSHRGSHGGVELARASDVITLREIVEAVEGEIAVNACTGTSPFECYRAGCSIKGALREAQGRFLEALEGYTLARLALEDQYAAPMRVANG